MNETHHVNLVSIIRDLFDHNDWANTRILQICAGLTAEQLDQVRSIGFGSLRNILYHLAEAEQIWLERWLGEPWRTLQTDAAGMSILAMQNWLTSTAQRRNELLSRESSNQYLRKVTFRNLKGIESTLELSGLLNHVTNHGIHHRAQLLNLLRGHGITIPGGLDYLFWKIARPSCPLDADSIESLRAYGLEVNTAQGNVPEFDDGWVRRYFSYLDWAMTEVFTAMKHLTEESLDCPFEMGMGSLRKNLQHMIDAERWWLQNYRQELAAFPHGEEHRSLAAMQQLFLEVQAERQTFLDTLDTQAANRIVRVTPGGPILGFRVTESLLQLCGHATHHRAQCLNMLRHLQVPPPALDFIVWYRMTENSTSSN